MSAFCTQESQAAHTCNRKLKFQNIGDKGILWGNGIRSQWIRQGNVLKKTQRDSQEERWKQARRNYTTSLQPIVHTTSLNCLPLIYLSVRIKQLVGTCIHEINHQQHIPLPMEKRYQTQNNHTRDIDEVMRRNKTNDHEHQTEYSQPHNTFVGA